MGAGIGSALSGALGGGTEGNIGNLCSGALAGTVRGVLALCCSRSCWRSCREAACWKINLKRKRREEKKEALKD